MELRKEKKPAVTVFHIKGSVGQEDTALFLSELGKAAESNSPRIVLDVSEMHYICSMALSALVKARNQAKSGGGDVRIADANKVTKNLLEATNLNRVFMVFPSLHDALESFSES